MLDCCVQCSILRMGVEVVMKEAVFCSDESVRREGETYLNIILCSNVVTIYSQCAQKTVTSDMEQKRGLRGQFSQNAPSKIMLSSNK